MAKPAQIRRQAQDAEDLIKALNAPPGAPQAGDPPQPPAPQPPAPQPPAPQPPAPQPPAPQPPAPQPPADDAQWQHKYSVLQGKYDTEMARNTELLRQSNERISALEQLLATMRQAPQAPAPAAPQAPASKLVTAEDETEYGRNMVEFVQRAARDAWSTERAGMQRTIDELQAQLGNTNRAVQQTAQQRMHAALDQAMPDWQAMNTSPQFLAWLNLPDVFSGRRRHDLLLDAYEKNDTQRVLNFFVTFKKEDSAIDPTAAPPSALRAPQVDPATLVAPGAPRGAAPGAEAPGSKPIWSQQEITEFYDRKRRGKVPADEAARVEREIILASAEGRVRG
jgi:hypothetical protein